LRENSILWAPAGGKNQRNSEFFEIISMSDNGAYIVSSVRTAVGKAKRGALKNYRPEEMGGVAVREAIARVKGLKPEMVDDLLIGCAFPEGPQGMNVARQIGQAAGLPDAVPAATVNRFCSSGLQTIVMAAQQIAFGQSDVVVAGGAESMTQVPMGGFYFSPDPEIVKDDPAVYMDMGNTAENIAEEFGISREEQDRFSLRSHERALKAMKDGKFSEEIVPIQVREVVYKDGKTETVEFEFKVDEGPRADTALASLAKLKSVFRQDGTITAGNSSQMSDGAAATVLVSKAKLKELNAEPLARIVSYAVAGVEPERMGVGPIPAIEKALKKANLKLKDIGLIELNEAFAAQALAVIKKMGLNEEIVNVNGGAIAMGHPLGCTGAKLTATLLAEMRRRGVKYGLCTMCVGGGMGAAAIFENLKLKD
jgi:acetyl-CoA acyltransferase